MKKATYGGKPKEELVKALGEKREDLRKLRFKTTGSSTRDVKAVSNMRKDIARIMTELVSLDRRGLNKNKA